MLLLIVFLVIKVYKMIIFYDKLFYSHSFFGKLLVVRLNFFKQKKEESNRKKK